VLFFKLLKGSNRPRGENSPNLVTLATYIGNGFEKMDSYLEKRKGN
jgi:hypothetical protein